MRITRCLMALAALAVICPAANAADNAMELFGRGFEAKQSGDLRGAQQLFERGLRIDPGNADARRFLAEVKEALGAAQKLFERGYNAKQQGDLRAAQSLFEQGLAIEPGNAMGQNFLAEVRAALAAAPPPAPRGPKESCADRPNFISRAICERRECERAHNAKHPFCEQYQQKQQF